MSLSPNETRVYSDLMNVVKILRKSKYTKDEVIPIIEEQARQYKPFAELVYKVSGEDYERIVHKVIDSY